MIQNFSKIEKVDGLLVLPGDKSISHRALIFSALANGKSQIVNLPDSDDINSTISCLQQIGIQITRKKNEVTIIGNGFKGFKKPLKALNAGNSGTTARLMCGVLSVQNFDSKIVGDRSLSKRPMLRIIEPLNIMGARISGTPKNTLPIEIRYSGAVKNFEYEMIYPSAQVKGSLILAGLHFDNSSRIIERAITRDHTERLLKLPLEKDRLKTVISVSKRSYPNPQKYFIPGDISIGSFFIILGVLVRKGRILIRNVSTNPTRTGLINILNEMGAGITINEEKKFDTEPLGELKIESNKLKNVAIKNELLPNIIDEIPALTIAGVFAEGDFEIRNAQELRLKETDRIKAICYNLKKLGLNVEEYNDGFKFSGVIKNERPIFKSFGDHRIAMAFGILSCLLEDGGKVDGFECVSVSNPNFVEQLKSITI